VSYEKVLENLSCGSWKSPVFFVGKRVENLFYTEWAIKTVPYIILL